jgi:hypothetical protein
MGLKRKLANIMAATTVPMIPARDPNRPAMISSTAVKMRGAIFFHVWPLAAALKATAAKAQTNAPIAASINEIAQSFPAVVFIVALLIIWVICMFFSWKYDDKRRGCCGKNRELAAGIRELR